jgi:hypothetical protein
VDRYRAGEETLNESKVKVVVLLSLPERVKCTQNKQMLQVTTQLLVGIEYAVYLFATYCKSGDRMPVEERFPALVQTDL